MEGFGHIVIRIAVIDSPAAERTLLRTADMILVDDPAEADVVVLDPDGEGLRLCSFLSAGGARVLVYAAEADEVLSLAAGVAGAIGVVTRPRDLITAVREAARGLVIAA
jgi:DNA-binding NarL/FixJ family response regulator